MRAILPIPTRRVSEGHLPQFNPTRERGTNLRHVRDICCRSLAHASGYDGICSYANTPLLTNDA